MRKYFLQTVLLLIFCKAVFADVPFILFGDWGSHGSEKQMKVASQMSGWAQENKAQFVISLGDNFYNEGVESTNDEQWNITFENVYYQPSLNIPWYVALGNHDYHGNVKAQIDYSNLSTRWKMPSRYFSYVIRIDDTTTALFVIIDTSPLALSDPEAERFEEDVFKFDNKKQLRWLDSTLSSSKSQWKFVCGHHPVYSGGYHGGQIELQTQVKPILEKNNVQAYFCGHDHDMQYLKSGKLNYVISGAGSSPRECENTKYTVFCRGKTLGFFGATLTSEKLYGAFIDGQGAEIYKLEFGR